MSRLRSNKVVNQAGTGAPELTYGAVVPATGTISGAGGINVTGVITATSFSGDGSGLTGVGDPSALKDGNNVKVQAQPSGATVTGILTVTNDIDANDISGVNATFSGNATVQGNLTVNGTTTTIDTVVTSVDSLAVDGSVGIGTTNPGNMLEIASNGLTKGLVVTKNGNNAAFLGHNGSGDEGLLTLKDGGITKVQINGETGQHSYINSGNVGIGSTIPRTSLDIGSTDAVVVPVGTTAQRPASAAAGMFRYNTTEGKFEGYTTEWGEIGGGGGGFTTAAHVANNAVVTLNLDSAQDHKVTATGICTITCTGGTEAQSHTIRIINSGSATVGFSTYFLFPSGNTPVLPSGDGAINLVSFTVNRVGAAGTQLLTGASLNYS